MKIGSFVSCCKYECVMCAPAAEGVCADLANKHFTFIEESHDEFLISQFPNCMDNLLTPKTVLRYPR